MNLRLNLGCGARHLDGFLNVDREVDLDPRPDFLFDLEGDHTWPWQDVIEVVMHHVLEHLGATPSGFIHIVQELYRVCAPGAIVRITVPHPRHDDFIADPTHVRPVLPETMALFSKKVCLARRQNGGSASPLALIADVDFDVVSSTFNVVEPYRSQLVNGEITQEGVALLASTMCNVVREIDIVMRAVK